MSKFFTDWRKGFLVGVFAEAVFNTIFGKHIQNLIEYILK